MKSGRWDSYDAYLCDLDGTLLHCRDAVHYFGFCHVLSEVAGRPVNLDGVTTHGNTDVGILRDAFARAGVPEEAWRPQLPALREKLCRFVEEHAGELRVELLPGVVEVLGHLQRRGAVTCVATGNLERIGWAKLAASGLRRGFGFGCFSDRWETRSEVFAAAAARARALVAELRSGVTASVCVIGDTPADVEAARENGLDVIAVATGIFSREELEAARPTVLVRSLSELAPG
ncbi:MAG TPA: HAD family hydrolase [Acidobacteriaceae bacterium]